MDNNESLENKILATALYIRKRHDELLESQFYKYGLNANMKKAFETRVSELSPTQRSHLAWILDHKTWCGYITAGHIARGIGEYGGKTLFEIFSMFDCKPHAAKIYSNKVVNFK